MQQRIIDQVAKLHKEAWIDGFVAGAVWLGENLVGERPPEDVIEDTRQHAERFYGQREQA